MTEPEKAKEVVGAFIGNAKQTMLRDMERALRKIGGMTWWQRLWHAGNVADKCLGEGWYWDFAWNPTKNKLAKPPGES